MRRFLPFLAFIAASLVAATPPPKGPERWAAEIDKLTAAETPAASRQGGIVFIGSSSIKRWTSLADDFAGLPVLNHGFGGSQLADSVHYADRLVMAYKPRAVVVYAGENDINAGKSPEAVHADFNAFRAKVHAALPKTRILYIAMKPSPSRWKLREKFERGNRLIADECARDPRLQFVDVWPPMLDAAGQPRPELFVKDMLHMNETGYAIWKKILAPYLR